MSFSFFSFSVVEREKSEEFTKIFFEKSHGRPRLPAFPAALRRDRHGCGDDDCDGSCSSIGQLSRRWRPGCGEEQQRQVKRFQCFIDASPRSTNEKTPSTHSPCHFSPLPPTGPSLSCSTCSPEVGSSRPHPVANRRRKKGGAGGGEERKSKKKKRKRGNDSCENRKRRRRRR